MSRNRLLVVLVVGVALVVTIDRRGGEPAASRDSIAVDRETQARMSRFWQLYRDATSHRIAGRVSDAATSYAQALELNPDHEDALYYAGNMHLALGQPSEARDAWSRLVDVNPASSRAFIQLGRLHACPAHARHYDLDAAGAYFDRALDLNKEETGPLAWMAEVAIARGDVAAADSLLRAVVASNFRNVGAHLLLGYIQWNSGNRSDARRTLAMATVNEGGEARPEGASGEGDTQSGGAMLAERDECTGWVTEVENLTTDADYLNWEPERLFREIGDVITQSVNPQD